MAQKQKTEKSSIKSGRPSRNKRRSYAGSLFIIIGVVFFLAISISSVLILQSSDENLDDQKVVAPQTQEQARNQALAAAPVNMPHPVNLGDIFIDDTIIDDGQDLEKVNLPPNVTINIPRKIEETQKLSPPQTKPKISTKVTNKVRVHKADKQVALLPPNSDVIKNSKPDVVLNRPERPMIAIVLDDVGVNRKGAELAIELPASITLAFMTYAPGVREMSREAQDKGHELMLHIPMEPLGNEDPGPKALLTGLSDEEILSRLEWGMAQFDGYSGINNHMGSKFTEWSRGMDVVMRRIEQTDYFFMDSRTSATSVAAETASSLGIPVLKRDVFIDNDYKDPSKIRSQLAITERVALKKGYAIAIGHPHKSTIKVLQDWVGSAESRGFDVVPISKIMALINPPE